MVSVNQPCPESDHNSRPFLLVLVLLLVTCYAPSDCVFRRCLLQSSCSIFILLFFLLCFVLYGCVC